MKFYLHDKHIRIDRRYHKTAQSQEPTHTHPSISNQLKDKMSAPAIQPTHVFMFGERVPGQLAEKYSGIDLGECLDRKCECADNCPRWSSTLGAAYPKLAENCFWKLIPYMKVMRAIHLKKGKIASLENNSDPHMPDFACEDLEYELDACREELEELVTEKKGMWDESGLVWDQPAKEFESSLVNNGALCKMLSEASGISVDDLTAKVQDVKQLKEKYKSLVKNLDELFQYRGGAPYANRHLSEDEKLSKLMAKKKKQSDDFDALVSEFEDSVRHVDMTKAQKTYLRDFRELVYTTRAKLSK